MTHRFMKAVGVRNALPSDQADALLDIKIPAPSIEQWDLLIQVQAVSVNPADCRMRIRKTDDDMTSILGWDVAGLVVKIGSAVSDDFSVGDTVFYSGDLTRPGGNSEFHAVDR